MSDRLFKLGMVSIITVSLPTFGLAQQKVEVQTLPAPLLPGTLVPRSAPPTQLPDPAPTPEKTIPSDTSVTIQQQLPEPQKDKAETAPASSRIREPNERFRKPDGVPGYPDSAFGDGKWCWSGWRYGPRIAPSWEYPGLGGGPKIQYPWGSPGYTGRNDERSLTQTCRLWGPPVPVYTPVPDPTDPKKLIYPGRNISSPGFVYGWVGPFPASPRYKHYAVNTWAQPNVDLSTGRPGGEKDKEISKPTTSGDSKPPTVETDAKKTVGYLTLAVKVPDPKAEVFVDGVKTVQTGVDRTFSSPELEPGKSFKYEVAVRWIDRGVTCETKKIVIGSPGEMIPVDFTTPEIVRAGR